jgi:hypothetical protein
MPIPPTREWKSGAVHRQRLPGSIPRRRTRVPRPTTRLIALALLIGIGIACDRHAGSEHAAPLDVRESGQIGFAADSTAGRYRIAIRPADPPVVLGTIHDWVIRLERTDGRPPAPTSVTFDGGMPSHGHGLTTAPRVTRSLGDGEYLVEGVKFHMGGEWELRVGLTDADGSDGAAIAYSLGP